MVSAEKTPAKDPPTSGYSEGHELKHRLTGTSAGEPDPVSVPASAAGVFAHHQPLPFQLLQLLSRGAGSSRLQLPLIPAGNYPPACDIPLFFSPCCQCHIFPASPLTHHPTASPCR